MFRSKKEFFGLYEPSRDVAKREQGGIALPSILRLPTNFLFFLLTCSACPPLLLGKILATGTKLAFSINNLKALGSKFELQTHFDPRFFMQFLRFTWPPSVDSRTDISHALVLSN